jgi:hypothetical protein
VAGAKRAICGRVAGVLRASGGRVAGTWRSRNCGIWRVVFVQVCSCKVAKVIKSQGQIVGFWSKSNYRFGSSNQYDTYCNKLTKFTKIIKY